MCNRFNIAIFFIFMFSVSYANAEFSQNKSYKLTPVCGDPFDDKSSTLVESSASFNTQHIDGFIDDSLVDCIETFYNKKSDFKYNVTFLLSSKGGSVKAAMKIGYILRKHNARTQISGDCFSSCFLIFVAGVERYIRYYRDYKSKKIISGRIGIHRPYFDSKTPNLIITKTEYDKMLIDLKKYFSDMNISLSVYDIMINTPPESLKFYDIDTIGNILPEKDPYYAEKEVFLGSWEYGISTHEYRNLSSKFEKTCLLSNQIINFNELLPTNVFLPIDVCKDIIFYNITPSQSLERRKILEWECNIKEFFTDKELESFKPLADEEKILNLSYRKLRSCMNSIMKTGKKIITEN